MKPKEKKILITEPGNISPADKLKLANNGVLVIEAKDPDKVKYISELESIDYKSIAMSALHSYSTMPCSDSRDRFVTELNKRLKEKENQSSNG